MRDRKCKNCRCFKNGKCLVIEDIVNIEISTAKDKIDFAVEEGQVYEGLVEILGSYLPEDKHSKIYEEIQDLIRGYAYPKEDKIVNGKLVDIDGYYCSKWE